MSEYLPLDYQNKKTRRKRKMKQESIDKLYEILDKMPVTEENRDEIVEIQDLLDEGDYLTALEKMKNLSQPASENGEETKVDKKMKQIRKESQARNEESQEEEGKYPEELSNPELEEDYIGLLLEDPKLITKYYIVYEDSFFEDDNLLNIYKSILFTEGQAYAPEIAKNKFNFAKSTEESEALKTQLKNYVIEEEPDIEDVYVELTKLFALRKFYIQMPIKSLQDKIVEITQYKLYHQMTLEEVKNAVNQVSVTDKFKQAILNEDLTRFLEEGDNNLTNGLALPFPILSSVFKGIRKGETMAFAMPSNSGKSRFTVNLASYVAFVHKKKVLIISNEMSEEKMKLCLITTILNDPEIQKIHGQTIQKTEGELLEFKFRPDKGQKVEVDEKGFIIKKKDEKQKDFIKRLRNISTEFNQTIAATQWVNEQMKNAIYFINITDHTNDELKKVIMNYYYKEQIEYIFYDTLKTDTANIGNGEELKKTATILSNLAQNFNLYICSTLQLAESNTLPVNLNINDLAVSRTVKEVLDTLCLIKQINRETYQDYEYSLKEVDTKFYELEKYEDPDVRYYACVVDKNRAGAKPTLLFKLNLAYNRWEELGYVRLKQ